MLTLITKTQLVLRVRQEKMDKQMAEKGYTRVSWFESEDDYFGAYYADENGKEVWEQFHY